jgi:membrane fusion protein (multidrug efflux system)
MNAQSNYRRQQQLVASGFISKQAAEASRTQVETAAAALHAAQASLEQARSALGTRGPENANVRAAQAAVNQARLDLEHTRVTAPESGRITKFTLRPGDVVQPAKPLFVLIGDREYWVDANFKETQLRDIRPGDRATVTVDMYPRHPFPAVVESVSGGSGAAFSLLPPQNATGNWVKVTQRVPVRVRVTELDPQYPLRIGTTAKVAVKLHSAPTAEP